MGSLGSDAQITVAFNSKGKPEHNSLSGYFITAAVKRHILEAS